MFRSARAGLRGVSGAVKREEKKMPRARPVAHLLPGWLLFNSSVHLLSTSHQYFGLAVRAATAAPSASASAPITTAVAMSGGAAPHRSAAVAAAAVASVVQRASTTRNEHTSTRAAPSMDDQLS